MKPESNDEQHFYEVTNSKGEVTQAVYDACPQCQEAILESGKGTLCDDHFIHRFGDLLRPEEWERIKARRGTAFVERWQRWIFRNPTSVIPPPDEGW